MPTEFIGLAITGLFIGSLANIASLHILSDEGTCKEITLNHKGQWFRHVGWLSYMLSKLSSTDHTVKLKYPVQEVILAMAWLCCGWKYGISLELAHALIFITLIWVLTLIDIDRFYLPDALTLPGIIIGLGFSYFTGSFVDSVIGAVVGYLSLWSLYHIFRRLTGKEGLGYGDFKMLAMIGAFLGYESIYPTFAICSVSLLISIYLSEKLKMDALYVPLGPHLALGSALYLLIKQLI